MARRGFALCLAGICAVGCGRSQPGDAKSEADEAAEARSRRLDQVYTVNRLLPEGMVFDGERFFGRTGGLYFFVGPDGWMWDGWIPSGFTYPDQPWRGTVADNGELFRDGTPANPLVGDLGPTAFAAWRTPPAKAPAAHEELRLAVLSKLRSYDDVLCVIPPSPGKRGRVVILPNGKLPDFYPKIRCVGWFEKAGGDWRVDVWQETRFDYGRGFQPKTGYASVVDDFVGRNFKSTDHFPDEIRFQDVSGPAVIATAGMKKAAAALAAAGY